MDFHEMKRKELQSLCKKHGVPANLTNRQMADRLHRLLQNPKSAPQEPISLQPSVLDSSDKKGNGVIAARSTRKQPKKVRFSPENQTFIFEASLHKTVGRMTRRGKSCVPSVDGQTEISRNDEGLKKRNGKFSVRVTRSRPAVVMESNDVNADLPIASKKRRRPEKVEESTHEQYDKTTENVSVKADKAPGRSVQRQLRSRRVTVLEDTDSIEHPQKRPRRSATQEIQPAQQNMEAKGTTTDPYMKSVISKNEEAGNGESIGVFETEKATKADGRQGPLTRRRQTSMVTSSSVAIADLDIQESIVEVKKGREVVMGSSSSSVVDFVEDETDVGKQTKVVRRSPRTDSVNISNMKVGPVLKATENQKESDEYRVRELEDEAPGGKNLALPSSATAMITRTLNSNSLDKAPEFTAKHCIKQVRRSARTAQVNFSDISVDPMAKASEKQRATEGLDFPVKSSSSIPVRRSGRNTSESTLHVSIAPVTEASETNRSGECRMERTEEEGPMTRHRRTQMVTSNSQPFTELDIQNSITRLKKQKRPSNKESDVTWLHDEINSTDSLMAASVKDGISVVGQDMKLKTKRKAARGTRRDTVYEKMVRSSRNTASASTMDVSVVPVAEASESDRRMAKAQEEALGDEKLMLPEKVGEGNFTSAVYGSADINSSHGALEFSDGSPGNKQVRRSARKALISSSDTLISPVKRTSAKKEESEFITCIEKETPGIVSPPLENITNSGSEAWESSDKGYSNKEVRSSAQITSLSSSSALISQTKRAFGKKRGSEPRRTSTEEIIPETKSILFPEKTTGSTSGALELSDKGCNDKQVMRLAGMASASASNASIGPATRASGKKRESESRIIGIEEEGLGTKSPSLPEKIIDSSCGALEFSDRGYSSKQVKRSARPASSTLLDASNGPRTRAFGKKKESESRIIGIEGEGLGIKSPSLTEKKIDSSFGALEFSDSGYSSKQVKRSARLASSTLLDASNGPKTRASGKKRGSESRISSIKENAPGIQSPFPNKMKDSSSKQVRRSARGTSITSSVGASVGPTLSASGERESECRITNIEEETPNIETPLLEKITESTSGALGFSDKVCSSRHGRRSARVASTTSADASIGLVKKASVEKRESEFRITGIEEETPVIGSLPLLVKTDSSNEALEFSDKGFRKKPVRRSERLESLSPFSASIDPIIKVSANKTESKSSTASRNEGSPGNQSVLLLKEMTDSEVELVTVNSGRPAQLLDSNSDGGTLDVSGRSSNSRRVTRSVHKTSPSSVHSSVRPTKKPLEANRKSGRKMVSIEEEDSGSADSKRCKTKQLGDSGSDAYSSPLHASASPLGGTEALEASRGSGGMASLEEEDSGSADSKRCKSKQLGDTGSDAYSSPLHASVSPLGGTEALEASRGSDRGMGSVEEEAQCSGSLSSPDKTANEKVDLAAPDSAMITKNLGSSGAPDFSGRSVYNLTEGLMTGYDTHGQLEIAEGEKDSAHADTLGASDGNATFSTSDTADGEMALENNKSEDVITAMAEETQCIELTGTVQIEIVCQADGSPVQTENSGLQLQVPPGDESMNSKCNQMGSKDGTASFQGGQQVITEAINRTDAKPMDEITREDTDERMDLKERSLLFVSCPEITEKPSTVHNSLIFTGEPCEDDKEELACSTNNDDGLAALSEQMSESQDAVQVTESAINNDACLKQTKEVDIVTEENRIITALEHSTSQSLASDMILHEGNEGENLLHDAINEEKLLSQAMNVNYEVEGNDMHGDAVEHKGDPHAVSAGKSDIQDGVVEIVDSLECAAKDKSESPETFILERQECKDVNKESRAESAGKSDIQYDVVEMVDSLECDAKDKSESLETFIPEIKECKDVNEESRAESAGKSDIQYGVVEIVDSLECDAKDKSESLETFIHEIQECKDVNEESRADSSMELDGLLKTKAMGSDNLSLNKEDDNFFQSSNVKDFDTSDQSAQPCSSCPLKKNIGLTKSERDGIMNFEQDADAEDDVLPHGVIELVSVEEFDPRSLAAELAQENNRDSQESSHEICDIERDLTDEVTSANSSDKEQIDSPGISEGGEKQDADAEDYVLSAQGVELVSMEEFDPRSLAAELAQENNRNPQESSDEICDRERDLTDEVTSANSSDKEQIASPGISKGGEKQEAVISPHFTFPVMQNRIAKSPCSTSNCDKTIATQSSHGVESQVESCGWEATGLNSTDGIYEVNVKGIEEDEMLEADKEQVMTDDSVSHEVLQHQLYAGNVNDGSNNMDKNVGNENEAKEDKFSSGETKEDFFFDHTTRGFEGPTPAEEWNADEIKTSFITTEENYDLNVDEAKGEKMLEADEDCVIGGDMIHNVAHDPEMLVEVYSEAENPSLELRFSEFKDHQGTAGLEDANKHSTEKGLYLYAERELKEEISDHISDTMLQSGNDEKMLEADEECVIGSDMVRDVAHDPEMLVEVYGEAENYKELGGQISGHISDTMLESGNHENSEHRSANLQMPVDHSAASSTIFTTEEHDPHDWLDIAFTLLREDKDSDSKVRVTDAATPAMIGDEQEDVAFGTGIPKTSGHSDEMEKTTEEDIKPDNSSADQTEQLVFYTSEDETVPRR